MLQSNASILYWCWYILSTQDEPVEERTWKMVAIMIMLLCTWVNPFNYQLQPDGAVWRADREDGRIVSAMLAPLMQSSVPLHSWTIRPACRDGRGTNYAAAIRTCTSCPTTLMPLIAELAVELSPAYRLPAFIVACRATQGSGTRDAQKVALICANGAPRRAMKLEDIVQLHLLRTHAVGVTEKQLAAPPLFSKFNFQTVYSNTGLTLRKHA